MPPFQIRRQHPQDWHAIRAVIDTAFNDKGEVSAIVARIANACGDDCFGHVAIDQNQKIIGHIWMSPAHIEHDGPPVTGHCLSPMAVMPQFQKTGIGKALAHALLDDARRRNTTFILVLGHPEYYPKFGFERADAWNISCPMADAPPEAFMIKVFKPERLKGISGIGRYRHEFD